jgi:hypothetical protein
MTSAVVAFACKLDWKGVQIFTGYHSPFLFTKRLVKQVTASFEVVKHEPDVDFREM